MTQSSSTAGPRTWALLTLALGFALASPFLRRSHQIGGANTDVSLSTTTAPVAPPSSFSPPLVEAAEPTPPAWPQLAREVSTADLADQPQLPSWAKPKSALDELIATGAPRQEAFEMMGSSLKNRPTPTKQLKPIASSGLPATTPAQFPATQEYQAQQFQLAPIAGSGNQENELRSQASLAAARQESDRRHSPWYHDILTPTDQNSASQLPQRQPQASQRFEKPQRSRASTVADWHTDSTPIHRRLQATQNQGETPIPQSMTRPGGLVSSPRADSARINPQAKPPQFVYQPGLKQQQ